jgi:mannose-1-phosphate guanylyltransferase/mannose-6-phosphate isomerase
MMENGEIHVVILAGGVGTRLWPVSRRSCPKQFQALLSESTMLEETYQRIVPLTSPERVWVVTGEEFVDQVRGQLPELPPANVLGEPMGRNSAPATALAVARVARDEPDSVVLMTPADSYIGDAAAYRDYVAIAAAAALESFIVTLGVIPSHPDTGYGYIKRGERLFRPGSGVYRVERFAEKPDLETAEGYLAHGGYYWNMGQFIFRAGHFMARCAAHLPRVAAEARRLAEADGDGKLIREVYRDLPSISLDYGIAEKERDMALVPTALEWSDVGNWRAVKDILGRHGQLDVQPQHHVAVDSPDCFVMATSGRLVVTVGVTDFVIIDTPDALLIVHEEKAQEVREALEEIERRGKTEYL